MSDQFQKIDQDPALPTGNTPVSESPIAQVEGLPYSFQEVMDRHPRTWTPADINNLILDLRRSRNNWAEEEAKAKAQGKKTPRAKIEGGSKSLPQINSLDDLDIKI